MPATTFSKDIIDKFTGLIHSHHGLYFKGFSRSHLERAIKSRMKACCCPSASDYYTLLTTHTSKNIESYHLLNLLSVNHSYFFRNKPHFHALKEKVIPDLRLKKRHTQNITIWSAGCSTGEEPYSIAIMLRELFPDIKEWNITIFATDISPEIVKKAKEGIYSESSMKFVTNEHRRKYFKEKPSTKGGNSQYTINDDIKSMVTFDTNNLLEGRHHKSCDIVFCRNVVIYFELESMIEVMDTLSSSLTHDGYFFVGHSENLQYLSTKFKMIAWKDYIYYKKASAASSPGKKLVCTTKKDVRKVIEKISEAEVEALQTIVSSPAKEAAPPPPYIAKIKDLLVHAVQHSHMKEYDMALSFIQKAQELDNTNIDTYCLIAEIYTNKGLFAEAKKHLEQAYAIDPVFPPIYYLRGIIDMEENNLSLAKENMKKALYLNKNFIMPYCLLSIIYKEEESISEASRAYKNTLKALSHHPVDEVIAYGGGMNVTALTDMCKNDLENLKVEQWN